MIHDTLHYKLTMMLPYAYYIILMDQRHRLSIFYSYEMTLNLKNKPPKILGRRGGIESDIQKNPVLFRTSVAL
jgi:hypothetical protein